MEGPSRLQCPTHVACCDVLEMLSSLFSTTVAITISVGQSLPWHDMGRYESEHGESFSTALTSFEASPVALLLPLCCVL
jgi:hypothetical protein